MKWFAVLGWIPLLATADHISYEPLRIGFGVTGGMWIWILCMLGLKQLETHLKGKK